MCEYVLYVLYVLYVCMCIQTYKRMIVNVDVDVDADVDIDEDVGVGVDVDVRVQYVQFTYKPTFPRNLHHSRPPSVVRVLSKRAATRMTSQGNPGAAGRRDAHCHGL